MPEGDGVKFRLDWPGWLGRLLKVYSHLLRVRFIDLPAFGQVPAAIHAIWHCEDLVMLPFFSDFDMRILISQSRDGAILSRAVEAMGFSVTRGSSSKGGARGLLAIKRHLQTGQHVIFAADGPRGPRQVAKPGAVYLAAKTGCPILPVGSAVSREWVAQKSWNKSRLPLPGAKVVIAYGPAVYYPPEAAHWPAHAQSRALGAAISDAVRLAEKGLSEWR